MRDVEEYTDIDDDEFSTLGASVFRETLGFDIDDVLDDGDEE